MYVMQVGCVWISLLWNLLVGIVLLSVCRTHTIGEAAGRRGGGRGGGDTGVRGGPRVESRGRPSGTDFNSDHLDNKDEANLRHRHIWWGGGGQNQTLFGVEGWAPGPLVSTPDF